jgi:hypothetical protein
MADDTITSSLNELINRIASEILSNNLIQKTSDTVTTFVDSSFKVAEEGLKSVQNITQPPAP